MLITTKTKTQVNDRNKVSNLTRLAQQPTEKLQELLATQDVYYINNHLIWVVVQFEARKLPASYQLIDY